MNTDGCPFCRTAPLDLVATFDRPPAGETDFGFSPYRRSMWRCPTCGHVVNGHDFDLSRLYDEQYRSSTYGESSRATFDRIMALPPDRSDNRQRAARIDDELRKRGADPATSTVLDVGSGLAVFPAAMRELGWRCVALDPDEDAARHAKDVAGVDALTADFNESHIDERFEAVTFNKVLEHVEDPAAMLARALPILAESGVVYVELPDADGALADGAEREEFFVEHHHAFTADSTALLARAAGFRVDELERLVEPSGKYTIRAFVRPAS